MAGAPLGNTNATKNKPWQQAIERALRKRSVSDRMEALDELAEKFLSSCDVGEITAFKELGDRLDGKAPQGVELSGDLTLSRKAADLSDDELAQIANARSST